MNRFLSFSSSSSLFPSDSLHSLPFPLFLLHHCLFLLKNVFDPLLTELCLESSRRRLHQLRSAVITTQRLRKLIQRRMRRCLSLFFDILSHSFSISQSLFIPLLRFLERGSPLVQQSHSRKRTSLRAAYDNQPKRHEISLQGTPKHL